MANEHQFRTLPFHRFVETVQNCCGADQGSTPHRQVTYLASYLAGVPGRPARSILVEARYVDRHYLEEYTAYYATTFRSPSPQTTRLHLFASELNDEKLSDLLKRAAQGELEQVSAELTTDYLGFVTVRPIPSAPIGRTMLAHYGETDDRRYGGVLRGCVARPVGIPLVFDALPFQQQDQGVGACASAALWSSLAKATREAGMRAPAPHSVTAAATKNWVTTRAVPAVDGLELGQFANAIRELGFAPYTVKVGQKPQMFLWTLKVYLRSGIPPVLIVRDEGEVHAVAVAGHKETATLAKLGEAPRLLKYGALSQIYVHDDRIGPYVKMALSLSPDGEDDILLRRVLVDDPKDAKLTAQTKVSFAIYPLYPKLRLTASDLAELAAAVAPLFTHLVTGEHAEHLTVEAWFAQNGSYLSELYSTGADAGRVVAFVRARSMSRYVGVIRWFWHGNALADVVCDTTDIGRETTPYAPILGIFFFNELHAKTAANQASHLMPGAVFG